ncbi:MAG: AEC family transporter [Clostridia bacterium]|nr:AEC family transporter [Clostridia bacterium]
MLVILSKIGNFFVFMLIGFGLGKSGLVRKEHSALLSKLLMLVFFPCNLLRTMISGFTRETVSRQLPILLCGTAVLTAIALLAWGAGKLSSRDAYERKVIQYSYTVPNAGYMGYPVMQALYGDMILADMMVFVLPVTVFTYTVGYTLLTNGKLSLRRLFNPAVVSLLLGMALGVSALPVPDFVLSVLDQGKACMGPVSMLLTGLVVSEFSLKEAVANKKVWLVSLCRLLFIPAAVCLCLKPFASPALLLCACGCYAMPCGLNTIVFPKLTGEDCRMGAGLAVVSNILALGTIPLMLTLFCGGM